METDSTVLAALLDAQSEASDALTDSPPAAVAAFVALGLSLLETASAPSTTPVIAAAGLSVVETDSVADTGVTPAQSWASDAATLSLDAAAKLAMTLTASEDARDSATESE